MSFRIKTQILPWLACLFVLLGTPGAPAQLAPFYEDEFERPDGPLAGWTPGAGTAEIVDGELHVGPTAIEHWLWAGSPAIEVPATSHLTVFSFDMEFLAPGTDATVGRHGGLAFCANTPTVRTDGAFNGYFVDWIDRETGPADRGVRLTRVDGGANAEVFLAPQSPPEPPLGWRVEVDETGIRVYGDETLLIDVAEVTYRGGYFGFWLWSGGEEASFDNLFVDADIPVVLACFDVTPPVPVAGTAALFDAACSLGDVASYEWSMGDGTVLSGPSVEHIYTFKDVYTVTLTVSDGRGNSDETSRLVDVAESLVPFGDDFERPAGPVDRWTAHAGEWSITDGGRLETVSASTEHWLWAGAPPGQLAGDLVIEFDMEFLAPGPAGVGPHGGIALFGSEPTQRGGTFAGYVIDWIERDRTVRIHRHPGDQPLDPAGRPGAPVEAPRRWRIEVEGEIIRIFGDGFLYHEVTDSTYRSGYFGLWTYQNQQPSYDNIEIATEIPIDLTPCFTSAPALAFAGESVGLDATCSQAGEGFEITGYAWDFGDGSTGASAPVTEHTFADPGVYTVSLTVTAGAQDMTLERAISVYGKVTSFGEGFEQPDGVVAGWEAYTGNWTVSSETLTTGPTTAEQSIWAGSLPVAGPRTMSFSFDCEWLQPPVPTDPEAAGRHAGCQFLCDRPTNRGSFSGYTVDWIDRERDRGVRILRVDGGVQVPLEAGQGLEAPLDPPLEWTVEVEGDAIRVFGDGDLLAEAFDATYHGGFFGFWTYADGQQVVIDNVDMSGDPLTPCFATAPRIPAAGTEITFDAGCSRVFDGSASIVSYAWDFGDGDTAGGSAATHTYASADMYTVTLTVRDDGDREAVLERTLVVGEALMPFADCFERPAGPVDGWTPYRGEWLITDDGALQTFASGAESWLWAGDPPELLDGSFVAEFDMEFLDRPADPGRHGGVVFFASRPTERYTTQNLGNGYTLDWLDRNGTGPRLIRLDGGVHGQAVVSDLPVPPDPPSTWRLEVDETTIRVLGDGVLYLEVEDATYRSGHFGLWTYADAQIDQLVRYDNLRLGADELPECGVEPAVVFRRGDVDGNGILEITDVVNDLSYQFLGEYSPICLDAHDFDDNGLNEITDSVNSLGHQFLGDPPPPAPGARTCGPDPTTDAQGADLGCEGYPDTSCGK